MVALTFRKEDDHIGRFHKIAYDRRSVPVTHEPGSFDGDEKQSYFIIFLKIMVGLHVVGSYIQNQFVYLLSDARRLRFLSLLTKGLKINLRR